jgi:hypothetical protein
LHGCLYKHLFFLLNYFYCFERVFVVNGSLQKFYKQSATDGGGIESWKHLKCFLIQKTMLGDKNTLANFKKQKISYHNRCNSNISNERINVVNTSSQRAQSDLDDQIVRIPNCFT